ncbi:hypothetical protein TrRE_jg7558 [Triparma retinervis]|uniref:Uncharacterized protein n=1 Tax=Triparma retinervis TaxID=2557542 RepID=A0A9W7AVY9_9STRA|nr:hypothetical protein TrRE_jg7558 [Triparma retinervis]
MWSWSSSAGIPKIKVMPKGKDAPFGYGEDGEPLTEYEKQRADRIARNNAYLESLGLKKNKEALRAMSTTKKKKRKSAPKPRVAPGEERRSSRMKNKADDLVMLSYDVDDNGKAVKSQPEPTDYGDGDYYEHKGRRFTGNRTISIDPEDYELSAADAKKLAIARDKITDEARFLNKMTEFLRGPNNISEANCRTVMNQVQKLIRGDGITYASNAYGWEAEKFKGKTYEYNGVKYPERWFMKGVKCDLGTDYVELLEHAVWCENTWGRDHGNGWLLNHPLKKLLIFQQFCLNNPDFLDKDCTYDEYMMEDELEGEWEEEGNETATTTSTSTTTTTTKSAPSLLNKSSSPGKKSKSPTKSPAKSPMKKTLKRGRVSPLEAVIPQPKSPSPVKKAKTGKSKLQILREKRETMMKEKEAQKAKDKEAMDAKEAKSPQRKATPKKATTATKGSKRSPRNVSPTPDGNAEGPDVTQFKVGDAVSCKWDDSTNYKGEITEIFPKGKGKHKNILSYDITFTVDDTIAEVKYHQIFT